MKKCYLGFYAVSYAEEMLNWSLMAASDSGSENDRTRHWGEWIEYQFSLLLLLLFHTTSGYTLFDFYPSSELWSDSVKLLSNRNVVDSSLAQDCRIEHQFDEKARSEHVLGFGNVSVSGAAWAHRWNVVGGSR